MGLDERGWVKENEANLHDRLRVTLQKLPTGAFHACLSVEGWRVYCRFLSFTGSESRTIVDLSHSRIQYSEMSRV